MDGLGANQFQVVHMKFFLIVEDLLTLSILLFDIVFADRKFIGVVPRRSVQKLETNVRLLRHNNHIDYVSNNNAVF